jgi:hypothetical protein
VIAAVLVTACTGSPTVAEVNGETISAADVNALSADPADDVVIPGDPFRGLLSLLVVNAALRTAAEEQFGLDDLNDPDRIAAKIANASAREQSVLRNIENDSDLTPAYAEGAAEFFVIYDAVVAELAPDDSLDDQARDQRFNDWSAQAVDAADIEIKSQVGIWGGNDGVLPPP